MDIASAGRRAYRMVARAEATAATRAAIVDAFLALLRERDYDAITLDLVARGAEVTVQTVIRHFGSKEELFTSVAQEVAAKEVEHRKQVSAGDVDGALRVLLARYERLGDLVLRLLSQEDRLPAIREVTDAGRRVHHDWVEQVFEPFLTTTRGAARRTQHAQLVVLTDLFTWRLLRRDLGLGPRQTHVAIAQMIDALLKGGT
jgi:AcrR family transcriptional regulator